jgi:hypothetical protein
MKQARTEANSRAQPKNHQIDEDESKKDDGAPLKRGERWRRPQGKIMASFRLRYFQEVSRRGHRGTSGVRKGNVV